MNSNEKWNIARSEELEKRAKFERLASAVVASSCKSTSHHSLFVDANEDIIQGRRLHDFPPFPVIVRMVIHPSQRQEEVRRWIAKAAESHQVDQTTATACKFYHNTSFESLDDVHGRRESTDACGVWKVVDPMIADQQNPLESYVIALVGFESKQQVQLHSNLTPIAKGVLGGAEGAAGGVNLDIVQSLLKVIEGLLKSILGSLGGITSHVPAVGGVVGNVGSAASGIAGPASSIGNVAGDVAKAVPSV
ncbi:hypothetical protein QR680_016089 [Steinernema hermaphroditum]|uniref:Uncharacterized protein n=1 Tax=Steinernema hermaphroditum TaxID=289476 RepID=A0AA39LLV3_9BILA|nr:hypothetical protein QR680_016089 [Steinernema hermaphroditum]